MSAATFVCPHCGHTYPFKPALIDKAVRCTTCKNAFRLKADGVAEKVTAAAPAAPKPAAPAPAPVPTPLQASPIAPITPAPPAASKPAPAPAQAPVPTQAPAPAQAPAPTQAPAPAPASTLAPPTPATPSQRLSPPTPKAGMTRQQEEARRQMAESLRSAMGALADEELDLDAAPTAAATSSKDSDRLAKDPKRSSERLTKDPKRSSERLARVKSQSERFKAKDGKQAGKGPAILTGEGEREAAIQRRWLMAFAALIVVAVVLAFLATRSSARGTALAEFTRELPANENRYGARIPAIQKRAWLPDVAPFLTLPDARFGRVEELPPAVLADALAKLKGLVWVPTAERWIAQNRVEWLTSQLAEDPQGLGKRLEKAGVVVVSRKALGEQLAAANLNDEGVDLVLRLLTSPLAGELAAHPPSGMHWCSVSGRGGTYISDPGQGYKFPEADYRGVLLQISGDSWPGTWKFASLVAVPKGK